MLTRAGPLTVTFGMGVRSEYALPGRRLDRSGREHATMNIAEGAPVRESYRVLRPGAGHAAIMRLDRLSRSTSRPPGARRIDLFPLAVGEIRALLTDLGLPRGGMGRRAGHQCWPAWRCRRPAPDGTARSRQWRCSALIYRRWCGTSGATCWRIASPSCRRCSSDRETPGSRLRWSDRVALGATVVHVSPMDPGGSPSGYRSPGAEAGPLPRTRGGALVVPLPSRDQGDRRRHRRPDDCH